MRWQTMKTMSRLTNSIILETKQNWKNISKFVYYVYSVQARATFNSNTYTIVRTYSRRRRTNSHKKRNKCLANATMRRSTLVVYRSELDWQLLSTLVFEEDTSRCIFSSYMVILLLKIRISATSNARSVVNGFDRWYVRNLSRRIQCNKPML